MQDWYGRKGTLSASPKLNHDLSPMFTILRWRDDYYAGKRPTAADVILLVEVAKSTFRYDRGTKLTLYAEAGVAEYWLVNLGKGVIEVYTNPEGGKHRSVRVAQRGEALPLPGGLEGSLEVNDLLGKDK